MELDSENFCIIGDFNRVVDNKLDYRTRKKNKQKRQKLPSTFFKLMKELKEMREDN